MWLPINKNGKKIFLTFVLDNSIIFANRAVVSSNA